MYFGGSTDARPCSLAYGKMVQQSEQQRSHLLEEVRVLTEQMSQPNQSNVISAEVSVFLGARKVEKVIQAR